MFRDNYRPGMQSEAELFERQDDYCLYRIPVPKEVATQLALLRSDYTGGLINRRAENFPWRGGWNDRMATYAWETAYLGIQFVKSGTSRENAYYREALGNVDEVAGEELWEEMCCRILKAEAREGVKWDISGPTISKKFLMDFLTKYLIDYWSEKDASQLSTQSIRKKRKACLQAIEDKTWPIVPVEIGTRIDPKTMKKKEQIVAFRFDDPYYPYYIAALRYLNGWKGRASIDGEVGKRMIIQLKEDGFLDQEKGQRYSPLFLLLAEDFLRYESPWNFHNFVIGVAQEVGYGVAWAIAEDLDLMFFPSVKEIRRNGNDVQRKILDDTKQVLQSEYIKIAYTHRRSILNGLERKAALDQIRRDPSGLFEKIFQETGAHSILQSLAEGYGEQTPEGIIARRALKIGKEEAIIIPIMAEISGYQNNIADTEMWMQILWTIIREADNTGDLHLVGSGGKQTLPDEFGLADSSNITHAALFKTFLEMLRKHSTNHRLTEAMASMGHSVLAGDTGKRNICWDRITQRFVWDQYSFDKYQTATREIAQIFSWFARFAYQESGFASSTIESFERILNNIGLLRLILNDLEDISSEIPGKFGNDIGIGATAPWAVFHRLLSDDGAINDLKFVENTFNQIGRKRHSLNGLTARDNRRIMRVVEISRRYLPRIAKVLVEEFTQYYESAKKDLQEAYSFLPRNERGDLDERNAFCLFVLSSYLDSIWGKIGSYQDYQFQPKDPEPLSSSDQRRITRKMRALCSRIASRELLGGRELPHNCPFVFWDDASNRFILGDVFFKYSSDGKIEHWYASVVGSSNAISMANHVANTIRIIKSDNLQLPYLADKVSMKALETLKGNRVERLDDDPLHCRLETPVGGIDVYLPDVSVPYIDRNKHY